MAHDNGRHCMQKIEGGVWIAKMDVPPDCIIAFGKGRFVTTLEGAKTKVEAERQALAQTKAWKLEIAAGT